MPDLQIPIPAILAEHGFTGAVNSIVQTINENLLTYPLKPFFDIKIRQLVCRSARRLARGDDPEQIRREMTFIFNRIDFICRKEPGWQHLEIRRVGRVENILKPEYFWDSESERVPITPPTPPPPEDDDGYVVMTF